MPAKGRALHAGSWVPRSGIDQGFYPANESGAPRGGAAGPAGRSRLVAAAVNGAVTGLVVVGERRHGEVAGGYRRVHRGAGDARVPQAHGVAELMGGDAGQVIAVGAGRRGLPGERVVEADVHLHEAIDQVAVADLRLARVGRGVVGDAEGGPA